MRYSNSSGSNYLILGFFFLTGLTGLAYELVWIRLLILAFGSTQFAVTTVLVVFMAGLALGSFIFGRVVDRFSAPLKVYAAIEIFLGLYCILSPTVFDMVRDIYLYMGGSSGQSIAGFEASQFALSFIALIVPATLMGGTLPVLVKYLTTASGRVGFHTAVPYSVNTLGAVTGCLLTGFFALYVLGVKTTVYTAGAVDILIGALVFLIYGAKAAAAPVRSALSTQGGPLAGYRRLGPGVRFIVIGSFALSGFASLTYEVLWTRVFSLVLGSSVYAFTIMLATFLAGIGIGSILFAPLIDKRKNPIAWFAALEAVIGVVALLSIFAYRELPFIFFSLKEAFGSQFWLFLFFQFLLSAAVMIIPTLCMGAIFPLVGKICTEDLKTVGKNIGDIYFFNTAGSIFGAFVGGFVLIPFIGVQNGVIIIAGLNMALCVILLSASGVGKKPTALAAIALGAVFVVSVAAVPPWERMLMTMGLYSNQMKGETLDQMKRGKSAENLLYYKEGLNAIITVRGKGENNSVISYQANGKQEAMSENGKPSEAWSILGHIPMLIYKGEPEEALLVGLGSGITLGAMEQYPLKDIDVVELEPAVIDAARFFRESNNDALDDPRVSMHVTDGRSFLFTGRKKYDIIISGVSDPWISGVSNLFTLEYFTELDKKLNDGGVVALWFQNYRITPKELRIGLHTFAEAFPYVSLWFHYTDTLDLVVIGSRTPHSFDMGLLAEKMSSPPVKAGLARINIHTPFDVLDLFMIGNRDLRSYIGKTQINTDERPILEFSLPKLQYMDPALGVKTVEEIINFTKEVVPPVIVPRGHEEQFYLSLAKTYYRSNFRLGQAYSVFMKVLELNPSNKEAIYYIEGLEKELGIK